MGGSLLGLQACFWSSFCCGSAKVEGQGREKRNGEHAGPGGRKREPERLSHLRLALMALLSPPIVVMVCVGLGSDALNPLIGVPCLLGFFIAGAIGIVNLFVECRAARRPALTGMIAMVIIGVLRVLIPGIWHTAYKFMGVIDMVMMVGPFWFGMLGWVFAVFLHLACGLYFGVLSWFLCALFRVRTERIQRWLPVAFCLAIWMVNLLTLREMHV